MMEEYSKWCDSESNEKEDAITTNKRTIGDLSAEVEELAGKISSAETELSEATTLRDEEKATFEGSEKEMVDTIDGLDRALVVLKRGQSFLQSRDKNELKQLTSVFSKMIEANWVNKQDKAVVQSLIQSSSTDGDEDLELQPQATTSSYESHGGGIVDTLADMKEKAEATLSDTRTAEMKAQHAYEMLKQGLETEISTMQKRMSAATAEKSGLENSKASAEEELAATKKTVADDEKYLEELKMSCSMKAKEWATRQKDAAGELAAIAKAKEVLESGVKVFLQVSSKAKAHDVGDDKRARVTAILKDIKDHTYFFAQLRSEAKEGPFDKVKGLIEDMIGRLEKEAAEEADAKAFCDKETSESKAKQAELTAKSDKYAVRIEKATATIAELKDQIKTLQAQMAEMDATQAEATALRNKEHEEYLKASKDYKDSAEAVANAISVLQEYYSSGSFVQAKEAPELGGAKTDIATTIMGMLEVAESDFTSLLAEAEASEKEAQSSYDKLTEQNKLTKTANTEEVKGKEAKVKSEETALLNYKEDFATTGKELDSVLAYLDKLKPQCETKVMTYAERVAKREAEIEGLKEALEILSA